MNVQMVKLQVGWEPLNIASNFNTNKTLTEFLMAFSWLWSPLLSALPGWSTAQWAGIARDCWGQSRSPLGTKSFCCWKPLAWLLKQPIFINDKGSSSLLRVVVLKL